MVVVKIIVETGEKHGGQKKCNYCKGLKLRKQTLQEKKEMVEMNTGARTCNIMHKFNFPESTVYHCTKKKIAWLLL